MKLVRFALLVTSFLLTIHAYAFPVQLSNAPENDLALTIAALQSAKQSILLNIYDLSSPQIADAITERINAGIHVEILEEGQPVGGLATAVKGIQQQMVGAMQSVSGSDRLFEMTSKAGGRRRFRFDHAKYAVIDGQALLIGSENYSPTGNPPAGSLGNRGWEVFVQDPSIASEFESTFRSDTDLSAGDVLDLVASGFQELEMPLVSDLFQYRKRPPSAAKPPYSSTQPSVVQAGTTVEAQDVLKVTSPDTSLSGLQTLLDQAQSSIDIEQMTFDSAWGPGGRSPLLDSVIAAARRGVKVRVLLNDERVFNHSGTDSAGMPGFPGSGTSRSKNVPTVETLNQLAQSEGLNLSATIADLKAMGVDYIHNKGVLVDGNKVLISSINWDENAVQRNREAAVVLTSADAHQYYEALFDQDWSASAGGSKTGNTSLTVSGSDNSATALAREVDGNCPAELAVVATIGQLRVTEREDTDFLALSNSTIRAKFRRTQGARGCVLKSEGPSAESGHGKFFEIRFRADGSRTVILEGFTPHSGKVYSIRAKASAESDLDGDFDGGLYDASGPSREKLGPAILSIASIVAE